jgi:hypothetical protein
MNGARFRAELDTVIGVPVLTMSGRLGTDAVAPCRALIDTVLVTRPPGLVLDVRSVTVDPETATLLSLIRRYTARRGVPLWLAAPPLRLVRALQAAQLTDLHQVQPTVAAAVKAALTATRVAAVV